MVRQCRKGGRRHRALDYTTVFHHFERYLAALDHLQAQGYPLEPEDVARITPLEHKTVNVLGRFSFALPEPIQQGALRPLRDPQEAAEDEGWEA